MHQVSFEETPKSVQTLISEAMAGEEVVFMRGPKPVVKLVPFESGTSNDEQWKREIRALRGILAGIDTTVPREEDRAL
jgi:antitoxin (DNA-binding transcriptional repressor) of toxin-antitoxin stability system